MPVNTCHCDPEHTY